TRLPRSPIHDRVEEHSALPTVPSTAHGRREGSIASEEFQCHVSLFRPSEDRISGLSRNRTDPGGTAGPKRFGALSGRSHGRGVGDAGGSSSQVSAADQY